MQSSIEARYLKMSTLRFFLKIVKRMEEVLIEIYIILINLVFRFFVGQKAEI